MKNFKKIIDEFDSEAQNKQNDEEDRILLNIFNDISSGMKYRKPFKESCIHDKEMICAFADGNLENKEEVEELILNCQSCFDLYTELKEASIENRSIETPENIKNLVLLKEENFKNEIKPKIIKETFLKILIRKITSNLEYIGSGAIVGGLAVALFMSFILPKNTNQIELQNTFNGSISTSNYDSIDFSLYNEAKEALKNNDLDKGIDKLEKFLQFKLNGK